MKHFHWNHRVVKNVTDDGGVWYTIREVFWNDREETSIYGYTQEPVTICGESMEELREYLHWCLDCLGRPVLEEGKIVCEDIDE